MKNLVAFPILALALLLQMAVASRVLLLSGSADLVFLIIVTWSLQERAESAWLWSLLAGAMVGAASGLPIAVTVTAYLVTTAIARLVLRRVWETPILAMFVVVFVGTLLYEGLALATTSLLGGTYPAADAFSLIILPTLILNCVLALPIYAIMRDVASWVYPVEELV